MIVGYAQPGKSRSRIVLEAFAKGCGDGRVLDTGPAILSAGDAAFYGVVGLEHLVNLARAEGRNWFYGDNAHLDVARQRYFRFAKNSFQLVPRGVKPDYDRLAALGVKVQPWRTGGGHIVVVEQSEHFLQLSGAGRQWAERVVVSLRKLTDRKIVLRRWRRDKDKAAATLPGDMKGAWALVTHMSAAANEALLAGVPVFTSGLCAATPFASGALTDIESPKRLDGREEWAARLAASQWTLNEIAEGKAWEVLNG